MAKEENKELQEKYMEYQMLEQQAGLIQKQLGQIDTQSAELENVIESFADISSTAPGTEILVPIASGVFVKAELKDNKNMIVNVGSGTTVSKTIPEVKEMLERQGKELENFKEELASQLQKMALRTAELEKAIGRLSGKE